MNDVSETVRQIMALPASLFRVVVSASIPRAMAFSLKQQKQRNKPESKDSDSASQKILQISDSDPPQQTDRGLPPEVIYEMKTRRDQIASMTPLWFLILTAFFESPVFFGETGFWGE